IAPSRRDTRPTAAQSGAFGRRAMAYADVASAAQPERPDLADGRNWFGLTPAATIGAMVGLVLFVGWRGVEYKDAGRVLAEFDPRPATAVLVAVSRSTICGLGAAVDHPFCAAGETARLTERLSHQPGPMGRLFATMPDVDQTFRSDTSVTDKAAPEAIVAEVQTRRCFPTDSYVVGQFGLHPVIAGAQTGEFAIEHWLAAGDYAAHAVTAAADQPDAALLAYLAARKERLRMVHEYFGEPGLTYGLQRFSAGDHAGALAILRRRLADPTYVAALAPAARAEMQLLAEAPGDFIPCRARGGSTAGQ
ncbi:MAG: hypothetical protein JWM33_939, partial [Caulobacteraceae bacterium]|nr:hypothetical protein [Caulobacteraceae bacterium]